MPLLLDFSESAQWLYRIITWRKNDKERLSKPCQLVKVLSLGPQASVSISFRELYAEGILSFEIIRVMF